MNEGKFATVQTEGAELTTICSQSVSRTNQLKLVAADGKNYCRSVKQLPQKTAGKNNG